MSGPWYHGTTAKRFSVGQIVKPGNEIGFRSNYLMIQGLSPKRQLVSGRTVHMHDVVWITSDVEEAAGWAHHSILKALPSEIRGQPAGGIAVYEVEPINLDHPSDVLHSATEAVCDKARVVHEVLFDEFPQDLCDECGKLATVRLGSDDQLCAECSVTR